MSRQFQIEKAVRTAVQLLIAIVGPSGSGKTNSALLLALGIQKVFPGPIIGIDTENGRMSHYADVIPFEIIDFKPPYSSTDYRDALLLADASNPSIIIVDSISHEHEGEGGYLEFHDSEVIRLAGDDFAKRKRIDRLAWKNPVLDRRKLKNTIIKLNSHIIFNFRVKKTTREVRDSQTGKKNIIDVGYAPIAGDALVHEMATRILLLPDSDGRIHGAGEDLLMAEKETIKIPEYFRNILTPNVQLSPAIGEQLAIWAKGDSKPKPAKKPAARPEALTKLEDYLTAGRIQDKQITIGKQTANLLEKAKGAIKYLRNLEVEFNSSVKGYKSIMQIIELIEAEPKELDVSREKDQGPVSESDELDIF